MGFRDAGKAVAGAGWRPDTLSWLLSPRSSGDRAPPSGGGGAGSNPAGGTTLDQHKHSPRPGKTSMASCVECPVSPTRNGSQRRILANSWRNSRPDRPVAERSLGPLTQQLSTAVEAL